MQTDSHVEVVSPDHYYAYSRHTERIFCNRNSCNYVFNYSIHSLSRCRTSKISKPAMSSTPMKYCRFILVSSVLLTRATSHVNIRPYSALARAATEYTTCTHGAPPSPPSPSSPSSSPSSLSLYIQQTDRATRCFGDSTLGSGGTG